MVSRPLRPAPRMAPENNKSSILERLNVLGSTISLRGMTGLFVLTGGSRHLGFLMIHICYSVKT